MTNFRREYPRSPDWICEACNGPVELLGRLGQREHGRCRGCGLDHHRAVDPDEAPELGPEFFAHATLTRPGEDLIESPLVKLERLVQAIDSIDPQPTKIDREYPLVLRASEWKTLWRLVQPK